MNILFTAVGRRSYLVDYFKSITKYKCRVITANSIADTAAMWKADKAYVTPQIISQDYISTLLEICKKESVTILISLFDLDTLFLSYHRKKFENIGVQLILSDRKVIEICTDKLKMASFIKSIGLDTPNVYSSIKKVIDLIKRNDIAFPLILKPQWGQGSIATEIVYNKEDLISAYTYLNSKIKNTTISYVGHLRFVNRLLIQEFISGDEYGVDCINDLKRVHHAVIVKKKISMRAGETDSAVTVHDTAIANVVAHLGNKLGHISIVDIDVIKRGKQVYIIDMNPRFGGGYPFSHKAGVNLPQAILDWVSEGICDPNLFTYQPDIFCIKDIEIISKSSFYH